MLSGSDRRTRRNLIALFITGAATPRLIAAQTLRRIGVLMTNVENDPQGQARMAALRAGLQDLGWTERRNLQIEWRWSGGDPALVRKYTEELVALSPEIIVANGTPVVAAMKRATRSIPVVFVVVNDPVAQGFVASMSQPGGNITGFSFLEYSVVEKSLELLKEIAPATSHASVIFNPETYPYYETFIKSFEAKARYLSVRVSGAPVRTPDEIEQMIAAISRQPGAGLLVPPDPFTVARRSLIIRFAEQFRIPAIYFFRPFVREGALISYGADTNEIFRRSASYVDRILKGAKVGDLPVQAPVKFELAINLKTAKALGLAIPQTVLLRADEIVR